MRVLAIGGGLGGLCLAQGLRSPADLHALTAAGPSVTAAIGAYETRMAATGFAAVRASLTAARGPAWLPAFLAVRRFFARR